MVSHLDSAGRFLANEQNSPESVVVPDHMLAVEVHTLPRAGGSNFASTTILISEEQLISKVTESIK